MVLKVKNLNESLRTLDLWVQRQELMVVDQYRALCWMIFTRLVENTPQYTGHAAASWNLGVGTPDMTPSPYKSDVEEDGFLSPAENRQQKLWGMQADTGDIRQRGDRRAIQHSLRRNKPKVDLIERGTKVYFTNTALGDMTASADKAQGFSGQAYYLEALQSSDYWQAKLREVNKPYETANETILAINEELLSGKGRIFRGKNAGKLTGGQSLGRVGGDTWEDYL